MKNFKLKYYFLLICAFLISAELTFAQNGFQTHLLKTEVSKTPSGAVKVMLYTNKPYSDVLTVNKKSDNEYIILLPETANTSTSRPTLSAVSDLVNNVEVKTQQYQPNIKGYTKVVIHTNSNVEIDPQIKVLGASETKLGEKDYKELLSQTNKVRSEKKKAKSHLQVAKSTEQIAKTRTETIIKKKQKEVTTEEKRTKPSTRVASKERYKNTKIAQSKTVERKRVIPKKSIQHKTHERIALKPVAQTIPETVKKAPIPQELAGKKDLSSHPDVITPEEQEQISPQPTTLQPVQTVIPPKKLRKIQIIKNYVKKGIKIVDENLYAAIGLLAAIFAIFVFAVAKISQKSSKQKEIFKTNVSSKPVTPLNLNEEIDEELSWKEKFQTYVKEPERQEQQLQSDLSPSTVEGLDDLFKEEETETTIVQHQPEIGFDDIQDYSLEEPEASIDELFEEEEEETEEFTSAEEDEEDELVKAEYAIDDEKGFYLVDFEDKTALVGHIDDEIFILKNFNEKIEDQIQARLSEKKGRSTNYMTKVGSFKGIVEVTPDKMNLLIEL